MDNLPIWTLWPITIAVWVVPCLAILSARSIARLLHRVLWLRTREAPQSRREPAHGEPAGAVALQG
jgi:hypothetical protein